MLVQDIHGRLNPTRVGTIHRPRTMPEVQDIVRAAAARGRALSIAGGRYASGGQVLCSGETLGEVGDVAEIDRVVMITAKGGNEPLPTFSVRGLRDMPPSDRSS